MVAVQYIRGASTPGTKELESSCWSLVHIEMKKLDSNASEGRMYSPARTEITRAKHSIAFLWNRFLAILPPEGATQTGRRASPLPFWKCPHRPPKGVPASSNPVDNRDLALW